jgi:hypothetical protein
MIQTTLGTLAVAEDALMRLRARPLAPVVAYRVSVLLAQVNAQLVHYHGIRDDLIRELGHERPATNGGPTLYEVAPDNLGTFRMRLRDLHAEPIELAVAPIDVATLGLEPMTPLDMELLRPLLALEGSTHG